MIPSLLRLLGAGLVLGVSPVSAVPGIQATSPVDLSGSATAGSPAMVAQAIRSRHTRRLRTFEDDGQAGRFGRNDNGGYVVNEYGFGNYVGGPGGGFAGYPAGSGEAFIYRQQQTVKCRYVPERC